MKRARFRYPNRVAGQSEARLVVCPFHTTVDDRETGRIAGRVRSGVVVAAIFDSGGFHFPGRPLLNR